MKTYITIFFVDGGFFRTDYHPINTLKEFKAPIEKVVIVYGDDQKEFFPK